MWEKKLLRSFALLVMLTLSFSVANAQFTVEGVVTDQVDGSTLPGVNIAVKGTTTGTSTDVDGEFLLSVPSLTDTLVFSFIGFQSLEVPINNRTFLEVELAPSAVMGEEMVVVGYGVQSRRNVAGSISQIQTEQLNSVAQTSINQMLQGRAPGLNMQTRSAQPGGGVSVNIRGAISPGGSNQPLYIVDGVPLTDNSSTVPGLQDSDASGSAVLGFFGGVDRDPLSYLNPSDIESITIMKDASAAAIYGSAAANGVVLITTKGGRSGAVQVDYRGSFTTQRPDDYFPMLNAQQFMQEQDRLAREYHRYENNLAPYGTSDPENASTYNPLFTEDEIASAGEGTNWPDFLMRNGAIQEHNISMSGGTEDTRLFGSLNYQDTNAILRNSSLTRYSGRLNVDQRIGTSANLSIRSTISQVDGSNATTGGSIGGAEMFNMIEAAYAFAPTINVFDEDGQYARTYNTLIMNPASFMDITDNSRTNNIFVAPTLDVNFSDNIQGTVRAQYDIERSTRGFYLPITSRHANLSDGMAQKNELSRGNYSVEGFMTYNRGFENFDLSVVAGSGIYRTESEGFGLVGIGFFTDAFGDNNVGVADDAERNQISSFRAERTKLSQFTRLNVVYLDRYVISAVARRDGSSVFSENNKYGFFPGVSVAWLLSEEAFMRDSDTVSELKLRGGYGLAGNESVLSGNTLQLYSPGFSYLIGNTVRNGVTLTQIANPDLTWETVATMNFGVDFGFYRNRLRGSVDFYQKTAHDLLDFNPLPFNNAVGRVADNVGSTRSRGIELTLSTLNLSSQTFRWSTDFNISYYESYWLERNPQVPLASYIGEDDPLGAIYGWETAGIIRDESDIPDYMPDANPGNVIYVDQNGDGILNSEDVVLLGSSIPKYSLGIGNDFSYRNFDLRVFVYGNLDFKRYNNFAPNVEGLRLTGAPTNTTTLAQDVWTSTNPEGTRPGVASNPYAGNNPAGTDLDLEDASFIRIGDVSMSYTLPERWLIATGSGLRSARVFVNMQDIGLFTRYSGFDPEYTEANPYPKAYSTTFGIELQF